MKTPKLNRTPLWDAHMAAGGKMVDFAGWSMPIEYAGIIKEAGAVRNSAGMFDVSHMGRVEFSGADAERFLDFLLGANVAKLQDGGGKYTVLCNAEGGIIDDCIVYRLSAGRYLLVINAARMAADLEWIESHRPGFANVAMDDRTDAISMVAVQGPEAVRIVNRMAGGAAAAIPRFSAAEIDLDGIPTLAARTGYTGEDGFELMPPGGSAAALWNKLAAAGVAPCGLGSRDVLRLEAGLALYGNDITTETNPYEAALGWTVSLKKPAEYVARAALAAAKERGPARRLSGLRMAAVGVPRAGMAIVDDGGNEVGRTTSGTFSPTLQLGVAMGYINVDHNQPGNRLQIDIRGNLKPAEVVKLPFHKAAMG